MKPKNDKKGFAPRMFYSHGLTLEANEFIILSHLSNNAIYSIDQQR